MKKTHSANIGGTVFQVEEDAYEHLQAYLQSIEAHFQCYPDIAEIIADIEGRIAEQLLERELAPQVVRMADVERVIAAMGRIEQFGEADTAQPSPDQARRLFRDPDNKVIAGVAAGLASYLGVPRLLVRVLFLLLLFFFGTALIVYLLLWALVPVASSTTDKLQMRGRPLTLASIEQGVRDGAASIPKETRNMAVRGVTAVGSLIHLLVVTLARALKWATGLFVVGIAALGVLFLTVAFVVALVNAGAPPLPAEAADFFARFGKWQHEFKAGVYLVAVIPLAVIIAAALRLFWGTRRVNSKGLAALLGVWVVALLATAAIWSSAYPELRKYWDEYPATSQAHRALDRFSMLAATTSPLSAEQADALLATLLAEYRRRNEEPKYRNYRWGGPRMELEWEEEIARLISESDRRIIEAARSYLDEKQLTVIEDSMAGDIARLQARLQARRERLDNLEP